MTILTSGRTPEEWSDIFAARGLTVGARLIRERARALGACHVLGKAMLITESQMDLIWEDA
jgi:hypothetical protein